MPQVLDYSAGFPGAANIKRAGYIGAVRYIGTPNNIKCTTAAELKDFTANGLGMALVFEQYATDWRGGWQAGFDNYRRARAHAIAVGFPANRPIYMAVDQDVVSPAEFQQALDYVRGARDAAGGDPGLVGVYGEHDVCHAVASWRGTSNDRLCDFFWQCRAWSGTPVRLFAGRHLYQQVGTVTVGGVGCDINDVLRDDWGQHAEDDMNVWDLVGFRPNNNQNIWDALKQIQDNQLADAARDAALANALAAATKNPAITPEALRAELDAAVKAHFPTAEEVAAAQRPYLLDVVREALGEDNATQAEAFVDAVVARLAGNTTPKEN